MASTTGTLVQVIGEKGTLSAPSFASVFIEDGEGEQFDFFAQGKLANRLIKDSPDKGTTVTIEHDGHRITNFEVASEQHV